MHQSQGLTSQYPWLLNIERGEEVIDTATLEKGPGHDEMGLPEFITLSRSWHDL